MSGLRAKLAEVLIMYCNAEDDGDWRDYETAAVHFLSHPALARALEDAERYSWLRDHAQTTDFGLPRWTVAHEHGGFGQTYRGEQLDTAIDAARAKV